MPWPLVLGSLLGAVAAALGFIAIADFSTAVRGGASEASKAWRDPYA